MKVIITGGSGQLGSELKTIIEEAYSFSKMELDISDIDKVYKTFWSLKPDVVIHCGAFTKVDGCEENPKKAYEVNAIGTKNIAEVCEFLKATMVYISTAYVFDGTKNRPYDETDIPNPINIYGRTKLIGEYFVRDYLKKHYIIRTSWLYSKKGDNVVNNILKSVREKKELMAVYDQFSSPTYVKDLADAIKKLIVTGDYGIFHFCNNGYCSYYDIAKKIVNYYNAYDLRIMPIKYHELNRIAARPQNSSLNNNYTVIKLRDWEEALLAFLKEV